MRELAVPSGTDNVPAGDLTFRNIGSRVFIRSQTFQAAGTLKKLEVGGYFSSGRVEITVDLGDEGHATVKILPEEKVWVLV